MVNEQGITVTHMKHVHKKTDKEIANTEVFLNEKAQGDSGCRRGKNNKEHLQKYFSF
jgi:hypothetical protein